MFEISRLVLKIVLIARQQATALEGKRQETFREFTFCYRKIKV